MELQPFESTPITQPFSVNAELKVVGTDLHLDYRLSGPLTQLKLPQAGELRPTFQTELWQHTCFELFLKAPDSPLYWEWNFSPNLSWGYFAFDGYRQRIETKNGSAGIQRFEIIFSKPDICKLKIILRPDFSPWLMWALTNRIGLTAGLSTILEHRNESKSYWALKHVQPKPDFHAPQSFAWKL